MRIFFIKELNGFPRTFVNHMIDTIDINGILKLMEGIEDRYCEFRSWLSFYNEHIKVNHLIILEV